jgi:tetratricopeptide (TPR) repeat protein
MLAMMLILRFAPRSHDDSPRHGAARAACLALSLWLLVLLFSPVLPLAAAEVKAHRGQLELPTYPWWPAVKHPYFRQTDKLNIYPYPMLDQLSRTKVPRTYQTVVLENEYLRVTILPELGGKVHEVIEKASGRSMFYVNHVVKPGLIGQCGAWTSGGIEWNTGPQGHTVSCLQPVTVAILSPEKDGARSVAIGEVERIYGTRWTVVLTLRPGRSFLEETIRIYNGTDTVRPYYFWNCTAMPNPPGFRFIYPMTLGCDHGGTQFYSWPMSGGKDLSWGTNYQDGSSIFAWHCDQDFFGSYDAGSDHGVVSYANHYQVPGKKAWTWGQGSYGRMHQMDLTDADGPYNEVQTGPLLTQAEVGRLDPLEAVAWQEWWYPVQRIGGFTYANRDVAANATLEGSQLRLRLLGTGTWAPAKVQVRQAKAGAAAGERKEILAQATCRISPLEPADLKLDLGGDPAACEVTIAAAEGVLAQFRVPLDLPARTEPGRKPAAKTGAELAQAGWRDYLFARFDNAEAQFRKALEQDARSVSAQVGLAVLKLDSDPAAAAKAAGQALEVDPNAGLAHFVLAAAKERLGDDRAALEEAWQASLDPATAVAGRALVGKCLLRQHNWNGAVQALSGPGPWQSDPTCRNRLALAYLKTGEKKGAVQLAKDNLEIDPLDNFARSVLWLAGSEKAPGLLEVLGGQAEPLLELVAEYGALNQEEVALRLVQGSGFKVQGSGIKNPLLLYWAAYFSHKTGEARAADAYLAQAARLSTEGVFPHQIELLPVLQWAAQANPKDGNAALCLGHLLVALGRTSEGRSWWGKAAQLGATPTVAWRAMGMASLNLDNDTDAAVKCLTEAHAADRADAIVARDLARVLFRLAEKDGEAPGKQALMVRARDTLQAAFENGKSRSDFVTLLARAQNRLGDYAATARMLDGVRIIIWEGAHEAHDLFEEAHLALGKAHLAAGRAQAALAEFNRALEYPENLATGKLERTREAHIHYLRGNALEALGQKQAALQAWRQAANEPSSRDENKEEARRKAREAVERAEKQGGGSVER